MPSLQEKLVREYEQLQEAHPYVPYGAYVKRQAEELLKKSKNRPKPQLSDEEIRLMIADLDFAKQVLQTYDPRFKDREPEQGEVNSIRQALIRQLGYSNISEVNLPGQQEAERIKEGFVPKKEDFSTQLKENEELPRKAELLLSQSSRLAPLSQLHTTAKGLLERNNPSESLRLGREEIAAAGRTDVPREITPYLERASETPASFLRQYEIDYAPVIENFRREAAKDFLEHDLPKINNHFASKGAFYSGAREHALNKARADKEQRIEHEVAKLLMHGREEGMKHFHQQRQGHLKQAEVAGHAHQAQQDSRLRSAEALRVNSGMEQAALHQQASGLEQLGRTEQQQAQNELNVRQLEHREEMNRPLLQHTQKAAIASSVPTPVPHLSPESINPPPPSVYGLGAGLIGQMAGLVGQQTQHHAQGGHVRQRFASGDSVTRAANQLNELRKHVHETPEEAEMREAALNFKNHRANPMADYLFAAGSHQLANLSGSPMRAYGEGAKLGMQAFKSAQGENLSAQEKYYNLMNKVNQTKMDTHQFLAKYHSLIQQQEEAERHHRNQEAETRRTHDMMHSLRSAKLEPSVVSAIKPVKMSATEIKLENEAKKDLLRALRMKKEIGHLGKLVKETSTGPLIGGIKSLLPSTKVDNQIEVGTNKLILDMHQGMKNIPRSEEFLKRIETTKPNRKNYPEANEEALKMMDEGANDVLEHGISTLLAAGWSPEKIERQFKIKIPEHLLDQDIQSDEDHENPMINMVDPNGNPLMVPQDQIDEALSLGATIEQ